MAININVSKENDGGAKLLFIEHTLYNIGLDKKIFGDKSVFLNFSFGCKFNLSKWSNFAQFKIIYILIK